MLHHVFPTPIREVDLGIDPDQFKTYLNFVEQQNWCEDFDPWGNPHGYTTKIDYKEDILSLDTLKGLATRIDLEMSNFVFNDIWRLHKYTPTFKLSLQWCCLSKNS